MYFYGSLCAGKRLDWHLAHLHFTCLRNEGVFYTGGMYDMIEMEGTCIQYVRFTYI